ncbi:hypothetical protein H2O64_12935 [Kordia sp. YSTF-M3]|uniref:Bacteriocin n=1 Tax=Kordia aestuariivivens TaxID=2759037 RepID=A0ABR7QAI4_9FLAO|nr:hypothetical protein [Kordia aestuariivivens]MBC8755575.1 hypothetical protein [Kordia aestuariivivens]
MKKSNVKLNLNKRSVSNLKTDALKGGVTGTTCEFTNKYYRTCYATCDTFAIDCIGSVFICPPTVVTC